MSSENITQPDENLPTRNQALARSTIIVMVAFAIAKLISLAQTVVIADVFGVGIDWDTFVTANRIPELIFTLISGGALAHAFIPIFSSYLARDQRKRAWEIASHVINTIFTVTLFVSILVYFFAPWIVENVVAPGFDAEAAQQTVQLMRILLISTLIFSVSGIVMGILQSHNHFLLPALAPIMFDLGILFGVIVLLPVMGIQGVAWGAVLGAVMHLGIQIPGLIHFKARWTPSWGFNDPELWHVIRLMIPRVLGLGVFSFNFILMNNIATRLGPGSVSALDWGWRLMQIPQTLIGTAMGVVIFPTLAALSELGDVDGKRRAMSGSLRFILIASIPSAIGLIVMGRPLIGLLERGAFDSSASELVYSTLTMFTLGLIVHSSLEVVARSFYADKDTLTPLWAALIGATINFVLAFTISGVDPNITIVDLGVAGLALANSLGVTAEVLVLLWILRKRWHGIQENELVMTTVKALVASLVMAIAVILFNNAWVMLGFSERGLIFEIAQVIIGSLLGVIIFAIIAFILRMQEIDELRNILRRRTKQNPDESEAMA